MLCAFVLAAAVAAANEAEDPWSTTPTDPVLSLTSSNYESTVFHSGMAHLFSQCILILI